MAGHFRIADHDRNLVRICCREKRAVKNFFEPINEISCYKRVRRNAAADRLRSN